MLVERAPYCLNLAIMFESKKKKRLYIYTHIYDRSPTDKIFSQVLAIAVYYQCLRFLFFSLKWTKTAFELFVGPCFHCKLEYRYSQVCVTVFSLPVTSRCLWQTFLRCQWCGRDTPNVCDQNSFLRAVAPFFFSSFFPRESPKPDFLFFPVSHLSWKFT